MRSTKPTLAAVSVLLFTGAVALWLVQRQSNIKLQDRINALQTEVEQLSQPRPDDERLPSGFSQSNAPLPNEELHELLKLRNEVGLLRQQTNQLRKLLAENRRLNPAQTCGKPQAEPNLAAGDLVPVSSLAFAGYATPEATFQSTLSAHMQGDSKTFLQGFAPELKQEKENEVTGKSESDLAANAAAHFDGASVRILNSKLLADDQAQLTVFVTSEKLNNVVPLTMKKIAGEWTISTEK